MSTLSQAGPQRQASSRTVAAGIGLIAFALASALIWYGAYGDPHPQKNQEDAVPSLVLIAFVVAALVFGALVPLARRAVLASRPRAGAWCLGLAVPAVLALVAWWSGIPLVLGAAGAWLAREGRALAQAEGASSRRFTVALVLSGVAVVLPVAYTVVANTVA